MNEINVLPAFIGRIAARDSLPSLSGFPTHGQTCPGIGRLARGRQGKVDYAAVTPTEAGAASRLIARIPLPISSVARDFQTSI